MTQQNLVLRDFEIEPAEGHVPSEEEIFLHLCDRIAYLIEHNMEYLLSLLYRNDILEAKIHFALSPFEADPANVALAKLVMERQKERLATREKYGKQSKEGIDEDLRW